MFLLKIKINTIYYCRLIINSMLVKPKLDKVK